MQPQLFISSPPPSSTREEGDRTRTGRVSPGLGNSIGLKAPPEGQCRQKPPCRSCSVVRDRPFASQCHREQRHRHHDERRDGRNQKSGLPARGRGGREIDLLAKFLEDNQDAIMMPASDPPAINPVDIKVPGLVSASSGVSPRTTIDDAAKSTRRRRSAAWSKAAGRPPPQTRAPTPPPVASRSPAPPPE